MIAIACDHGGLEIKNAIIEDLKNKGVEYIDLGTNTTDSVDYPIFAKKVCSEITEGRCEKGILCCGTGIGMSIAANKHVGIRAACCSEAFSAELTRRHNDSNVLCFGARVIDLPKALELTKIFVTTEYEGLTGGRHKQRLDKIAAIEAGELNK
jgi:ribose 5-phosphate isomerase B